MAQLRSVGGGCSVSGGWVPHSMTTNEAEPVSTVRCDDPGRSVDGSRQRAASGPPAAPAACPPPSPPATSAPGPSSTASSGSTAAPAAPDTASAPKTRPEPGPDQHPGHPEQPALHAHGRHHLAAGQAERPQRGRLPVPLPDARAPARPPPRTPRPAPWPPTSPRATVRVSATVPSSSARKSAGASTCTSGSGPTTWATALAQRVDRHARRPESPAPAARRPRPRRSAAGPAGCTVTGCSTPLDRYTATTLQLDRAVRARRRSAASPPRPATAPPAPGPARPCRAPGRRASRRPRPRRAAAGTPPGRRRRSVSLLAVTAGHGGGLHRGDRAGLRAARRCAPSRSTGSGWSPRTGSARRPGTGRRCGLSPTWSSTAARPARPTAAGWPAPGWRPWCWPAAGRAAPSAPRSARAAASSGVTRCPAARRCAGSSTGPAANTAPKASTPAPTTRSSARCGSATRVASSQHAVTEPAASAAAAARPLDPRARPGGTATSGAVTAAGRCPLTRTAGRPRPAAWSTPRRPTHRQHDRPGQPRAGQVLAEAAADRQPHQLHQPQRQRQYRARRRTHRSSRR